MKKSTLLFLIAFHTTSGGALFANSSDFCQDFRPISFSNECASDQPSLIHLDAEWLYWTAHQTGLQIGYFTSPNIAINDEFHATGHYVELDDHWSSGLRVGASYDMPFSAWGIGLNYTYFPSKSNLNESYLNADVPQYFTYMQNTQFYGRLGATNANKIEADWCIDVNYADLDVSRKIQVNSSAIFTPHFGVRGLWIHQVYHVQSVRRPTESPPVNSFISDGSLEIKDSLNSYGVEGGFWLNYRLTDGLSLVGHLGGAILYAQAKLAIATTLAETQPNNPNIEQLTNFSDKVWQASPMLDYFLGLEYSYTFNSMSIQVSAGWEQHEIFDTSNWVIGLGNLGLQGLSLRAGVSF